VYAAEETAVRWTKLMTATFIALAGGLWVLWERQLGRSELERERAMAELDAFAGRVAHDLRGPLSTIGLGVGVVDREDADRLSERSRGALAQTRRALANTGALIEGLLAFARAGGRADSGAATDVAAIVRAVAAANEPRASGSQISLECDVEPGLRVGTSQGVRTSILDNLVRNAIDHMGDAAERKVVVRARHAPSRVALEVADTGPGIPADVQRRLFQP